MGIKWFNDNLKDIIVTLTSKNITINKIGTQFFETAKEVMLGYDLDKKVIVIKPLTKEKTIRGDIPEHTRYNVSISSSYVRISNKAFLKKMNRLFSLGLNNEGSKYKAKWQANLNVLEVSLEEVL